MSTNMLSNIGATILAAGRGTRLGCTDCPKVMLEIGGKPIVAYTVGTLEAAGFARTNMSMVVGFQANSVKQYFKQRVRYAVQKEQIGTGHAAYLGILALPEEVEHVLVLGGDDSAFYTPETIKMLVEQHVEADATLSLLSVKKENPSSLGRVIRDEAGNFLSVKEKEQITDEEKSINEVSTGTFCFNRKWYEEAFLHMPMIEKLGEYGLNTSVTMAREEGKKVQAVVLSNEKEWFGINTKEELAEADKQKAE